MTTIAACSRFLESDNCLIFKVPRHLRLLAIYLIIVLNLFISPVILRASDDISEGYLYGKMELDRDGEEIVGIKIPVNRGTATTDGYIPARFTYDIYDFSTFGPEEPIPLYKGGSSSLFCNLIIYRNGSQKSPSGSDPQLLYLIPDGDIREGSYSFTLPRGLFFNYENPEEVSPEQTFEFNVSDIPTSSLIIPSASTGLEEEEEVVYYSIDGMRTVTPREGEILIRKKGLNISKIIIRCN